jgi:hypothetical protein
MQIRYPSLAEADYAELLACLDRGLSIFDRMDSQLSPAELQVKGILTALRNDLTRNRAATGRISPSQ